VRTVTVWKFPIDRVAIADLVELRIILHVFDAGEVGA
jgi:hypothetical protein